MTAATAHPDDLLLVRFLAEHRDYPSIPKRQVISTISLPRALEGRRFRRLFVTDRAAASLDLQDWQVIECARAKSRPPYGEIVPASLYRPQPIPTAWDRLRQTFTELIARYG